ncbi:IPT/TIG domain-containing protein [Svornostia abyssi]|uniref:IPT/TIG domain-containing protein n=1 Tax=Svornostia abyssi TaxID=2898438 RepID=A0ABY5PLB9_9ACTN|nr:IPT/TIG domain-containing protein [Parviterribacteraceae bacterium J379]
MCFRQERGAERSDNNYYLAPCAPVFARRSCRCSPSPCCSRPWGAAHALPEDSGNPGKVRFVKRSASAFDQYSTQAYSTWLNQKLWRFQVSDDFFRDKTSWYTRGWVYWNSFGIWPDDPQASTYGLKTASGADVYLKYGSEDGAADRRAGDITNPAFRAARVAELKELLTHGYKGAWIDDVNLDLDLWERNGTTRATPYSPWLGRTVTAADWRIAMTVFMEEIRAAIPDKELMHNAVWYHGRVGTSREYFPEVDRLIKSADYVNKEWGINADSGLGGGLDQWSQDALFSHFDKVHRLGRGVVIDDDAASNAERNYVLANYLLVSDGKDGITDTSQTPVNWWPGWDTDLGQPKGPRYKWQGAIRRDFAGGTAIIKEQGAPAGDVTFGGPMQTLDGATVSKVTLGPRQGVVLKGTPVVPTFSRPTITSGPGGWYFDNWNGFSITGTNLKDAEVTIGGRPPARIDQQTDTAIDMTLSPVESPGPQEVKVTNPAGSATTTFTYTLRPGTGPSPTISSLSATKGFYDVATPVTISGANFVSPTVTLDGEPLTPTATSSGSITVTIPKGVAPGPSVLKVTTNAGTATTTFTCEARSVAPAPTISSMTPTKGFFDVATPVTITGTYLTGALVTVNGSSVTPSSVSATSVALTVPAGTATGSVPIKITTAGGSVTTTFTREARPVNPAPAITGVSRSLDQANNRFIATITGTGFTGATRVDFGTVASPAITVNSSTQITAVVPAQTGPLTVSVRVTTPAGTSPVVVPGTWQYFGAPKITSVTPSRGVAGTQVEVRGTGLEFARATVGGRVPASVSYPDQFDFLAPSGLTGTQPVVLTTPEGTASTTFTYEPVPTIASLSVTKGYVDVATPLELKGTNLIGTTVKVNGTTVVPSKVTPTSMVLTVPKGTAAGNATIAVTGPGGTATTTFAYITRTSTAPTITGISATSWYWNIATQVTISGTNLSAATLQVNGTTVTPKSRTATAVTVLLPVGSTPGTVATITLSTTAGTATTLYNWAPYLATSVAPNGTFEAGVGSWTAGSGVTMTSATDQKRSGTRSLKYVTTGAGIPVESLATSGIAGRYQVGGWALVPAGVVWSLDLTDATGAIYARASAVGTGAWQYVSVVGVTASTRPGVKFRTASGATAWLDDVAVQAAT